MCVCVYTTRGRAWFLRSHGRRLKRIFTVTGRQCLHKTDDDHLGALPRFRCSAVLRGGKRGGNRVNRTSCQFRKRISAGKFSKWPASALAPSELLSRQNAKVVLSSILRTIRVHTSFARYFRYRFFHKQRLCCAAIDNPVGFGQTRVLALKIHSFWVNRSIHSNGTSSIDGLASPQFQRSAKRARFNGISGNKKQSRQHKSKDEWTRAFVF